MEKQKGLSKNYLAFMITTAVVFLIGLAILDLPMFQTAFCDLAGLISVPATTTVISQQHRAQPTIQSAKRK